MCVLAEYGRVSLPKGLSKPVQTVLQWACGAVHGMMKLCGYSKQKAYRHFKKICTRCNGQNTGWMLDMTTPGTLRTVTPTDSLLPVQQLPFEELSLTTVADPDRYLTGYYGDYMTLPAPENRMNHPPMVLDFDK